MKLFIVILIILVIFFIPIPIKFIFSYSSEDYYIKIYKITILSKKRPPKRDDPVVKKEHKFFSNLYKNINYRFLISNIYNLNIKFKPLLSFKFSIDYSLNDAAKTAIFCGVLWQSSTIIYIFLKFIFKVKRTNLKINPIYEDRFLLKIESSSIIFLSFANIIYMTIIFYKMLSKQGR